MVDDDRVAAQPGPRALEDVVDGGVIGEGDVDVRGASDGGCGIVEGPRAFRLEGARLGRRPIPDLNVQAAPAHRANEVGSEKTGSEECDHVRTSRARVDDLRSIPRRRRELPGVQRPRRARSLPVRAG